MYNEHTILMQPSLCCSKNFYSIRIHKKNSENIHISFTVKYIHISKDLVDRKSILCDFV